MNGAWVFLNFMHSLNSNDFLENSITTKHRKMSKFSRKCILENPPPSQKKNSFSLKQMDHEFSLTFAFHQL